MSIAVHRWLLQGNDSWQERCRTVVFHVLLIKISCDPRLNCHDALMQAFFHAFAKVSYFSEKWGNCSPSERELRAGWFWTNSWHNKLAIQVRRFDHRISEVDSINKSLYVRYAIRVRSVMTAKLFLRALAIFPRWEWFARRFHDAIKSIWYHRLILQYIAEYLNVRVRTHVCVCNPVAFESLRSLIQDV